MRLADVKRRFEDVLVRSGCDPVHPDARSLVDSMLRFYRSERVDDAAPLDEDGDMLLFQWGTYDWGGGSSFEFDLTRQCAERDMEGDDGLWQLRATLLFDPSPETAGLGSGNRWCHRPAEVDTLQEFIAAGAALAFAESQHAASRFELTFTTVS